MNVDTHTHTPRRAVRRAQVDFGYRYTALHTAQVDFGYRYTPLHTAQVDFGELRRALVLEPPKRKMPKVSLDQTHVAKRRGDGRMGSQVCNVA